MRKYRVLLADDHAIIRDGLKQILADTEDLEVCGEAANGNEAMQKVRAQDWDVLVLDISMPGRNGLELIRMIKDEKPDLFILILSMHHEEQYAVRALHAGASGYLTKESDSEVLVGCHPARGWRRRACQRQGRGNDGARHPPGRRTAAAQVIVESRIPGIQHARHRGWLDRDRRRALFKRQDRQHAQDQYHA